MRISDWSSDVCSSDLARGGGDADPPQPCGALGRDRVMEAAFDAVAAGAQEIRLTVNGKPVALVVDPRERLSEALRHELGLTGTKVGCSAGEDRKSTRLNSSH